MNKIKIFSLVSVIVIFGAGALIFLNNEISKNNRILSAKEQEQEGKVLGTSSVPETSSQVLDSAEKIFKKISVLEAKSIIEEQKLDSNFKIIDIRTKEEFDSGNIEGAINIDFNNNFEEGIGQLNKNGTYLIYCMSGRRSSEAIKIFEKLGFFEVYDLEGGYEKWITQ